MAISPDAAKSVVKPLVSAPVRAKRTLTPAPVPAPEPAPAVQAEARPAEFDIASEYPAGFVRKPFGSHEQKLKYPERPGFHRHWFNDSPGRIARALEAGYKHVLGKDGKNVSRVVDPGPRGGGLTGYLMEIPLEWWQSDQAVKNKARDEIDAKIRRGVVKDHAPGQDGAYQPVNKYTGEVGPDIKMHGR